MSGSCCGITLAFGAIGFCDDYLKVTKRNPKGVPGKIKLAISIVVAAIAAYLIAQASPAPLRYMLALPFLKDVLLPLGIVGFLAFAVAGDGRRLQRREPDRRARRPGDRAGDHRRRRVRPDRLPRRQHHLRQLPASSTTCRAPASSPCCCAALVGAGLGFLWFNAPPAMVFMGDTGSLAIGGALGAVAVVTKHELVLAIVGGLFVLETVSVIVQVLSFKLTGRRVFRMAPLHHHFEQKGWAEPTIVIRFWIIAAILALVGLATLKLR